MQPEFRILHEKYPRLVPESAVFEHSPGWVGLLDKYFAEVDAVLPPDVPWRIAQIKEKFGTIRLYCEPMWPSKEPTAIFEIAVINAGQRLDAGDSDEIGKKLQWAKYRAEGRSAHLCEQCGKPGMLRVDRHWYHTGCDEHGKGDPVDGEGIWHVDGKKYRFDPETDDLVEIAEAV